MIELCTCLEFNMLERQRNLIEVSDEKTWYLLVRFMVKVEKYTQHANGTIIIHSSFCNFY